MRRGLKWSLAAGIAAFGLATLPAAFAQDATQARVEAAQTELLRAKLAQRLSRLGSKRVTLAPVTQTGAVAPEVVKRPIDSGLASEPSALIPIAAREPRAQERPAAVAATQPPQQRPATPSDRPTGALPGVDRPNTVGQPPAVRLATPPQQGDGRIGEVPRDFSGVQIDMVGPDQFIITARTPEQVEAFSRLLEELDRAGSLAEAEFEFVPLKHAESSELAKLLTAIYTAKGEVRAGTTGAGGAAAQPSGQQGKVAFLPVAQSNGIVVVGRKADLPDIGAHVRELDNRSQEGEQFKIFPLKIANATQVAAKLGQFFPDKSQQVQATATTTGAATAHLRMRVEAFADERSNSVFVYAGPADLAQAEILIQRMDRADTDTTVEYRYFVLKNAPAADVQTLLQNTVIPRAQAAATAATAAPAGPQAPAAPTAAPQRGPQQQGVQQAASTGASAGVKSAKIRLMAPDRSGAFTESGILEDITIATDPRANGLVVVAPKESMGLLEELIKMLDAVPNPIATLKVLPLVNADATAMLNTLMSVFGQDSGQTGAQGGGNQFGQQGAQGFNAGTQTGQAQPRTFALGGTEARLALAPLTMSVDQRTNAIIVAGSPGDLLAVEALVYKLDSNNARERKNFVYRLNNIPAEYADETIQNFLSAQANNQVTGALTAAATGALTVQQQIAQDVVIVADLATNSLVISASPRYFEEILKVIQILDRRPPQVVIQVLIAEVAMQRNDEFGLEFGYQTTNMFDRNVIVANQFVPGVNFNTTNALPSSSSATNYPQVGYQGLSNLGLGRVGTQGVGGFIFQASSQNVSVLLRALSRQQRLEVLSRPQLTTLDNRESRLLIGQQVPTPTGAFLNNTGTGGGTQITTQYRDVGVILAVQPQIGPDGVVVMRVNPQVSSIDNTQSIPIATDANGGVVASAPVFNVNNVETTIVAADGQTIVVAGLISRSKAKDVRKVPYLGDIPYFGNLFRVNFTDCRKRELIIVLTPRIVYCDEDVERVKVEETNRMEWCLPEVFRTHGDIFAPAYPSVEGGDRCTDALGQEIPANLKLPPIGRPKARTVGGPGGPGGAACCDNQAQDGAMIAPGAVNMVPEGQHAPNAPTQVPGAIAPALQNTAPGAAPIVPAPRSAPQQGPTNQAPQIVPQGGQPSLKSSTMNNVRMLPQIEMKGANANPASQQATNYPTNLVMPTDAPAGNQPMAGQQVVNQQAGGQQQAGNQPPPPSRFRRIAMGGVSRQPTAPAVVNQLDQQATAPTNTMQR